VKRPAPDDRGLPRAIHRARRATGADAPTAQARATPLSLPSSTRSTPSCTTPRPTSSSPRTSKGSSPDLLTQPTRWDIHERQRVKHLIGDLRPLHGGPPGNLGDTSRRSVVFRSLPASGSLRSSLRHPTHLRFIDSSMMSVSPDVDRGPARPNAGVRPTPAITAQRPSCDTGASRRCDPFGFGRRCGSARTWPRERCLDRAAVSRTRVRRQAARPEKLQSAPAANSFRLGRPAAERNSTLDAAARLGVRREAAVSRHQIEPLHAARLERQESRRPTRQWLPVRPGDAALWRRRRAVSAPPLARSTPAASRRAAVSAPSTRLPVLVPSGHDLRAEAALAGCCYRT
jgi:hypothetical protein